MKGFDYTTGKELELCIRDWRLKLTNLIEKGGYRRFEKGETFAHSSNGGVVFEVYGNITAFKLKATNS